MDPRKLPPNVALIEPNPPPPQSLVGALIGNLRQQIVAGLLLVLPFVITAWIVYWLYTFLENYAIGPVARLVVKVAGERGDAVLPHWFMPYVAPALGGAIILAGLYFLGFFARARAGRVLDAILLRLPIITPIHKSVRQIFTAIGGGGELTRFQRAVLVEFPHPGMRVPGFVTATCRDTATDETILCVYVPTTPVPTSGYMLLVPEDQVSELNWNIEQSVQAVVSFGLAAPPEVSYRKVSSPRGVPPERVPRPQDSRV